MAQELLHFTCRILEHRGAAIETKGEEVEALLPPELASQLGVGEHARFHFSPHLSEASDHSQAPSTDGVRAQGLAPLLITYGSPTLEKILSLLADRGRAAAVEFKGLYLKQAAPGPEIERIFQPLNARGRLVSAGGAIVPYGIFNFRYTAVSDEKKEGLISVALNFRSLAEVPGVVPRWQEEEWRGRPMKEGPLAFDHPLEKIYQRACCPAQRHITLALSEFRQSRERRLGRDIQRLEEYYLGIAQEIRIRLQKKGLSGEEAKREEAKAVAAERELRTKTRDLEEKYAVRVHVSLVSLLYLELQVLMALVSYQRRQSFRELAFFWNPLFKEWEPLACEACGENTFAFSLCDERRHVACTGCSRPCPACGRRFCPACHPQGCPACRRNKFS
jgi:hypothetical protein